MVSGLAFFTVLYQKEPSTESESLSGESGSGF
jgi:hypothetical protein